MMLIITDIICLRPIRRARVFSDPEGLMVKVKSYRDSEITRERIADMLSTNRTYMSHIIDEHSNLNFTQYVNSCRLEDAISIHSDVNNDMPLKAAWTFVGFKSMSTFYNLFQSSMCMTQAQYRDRCCKLSREEA